MVLNRTFDVESTRYWSGRFGQKSPYLVAERIVHTLIKRDNGERGKVLKNFTRLL